MLRKTFISTHTVSGLRTRYFPKSRIGQGLISLAPWLNIGLLVAFFVLLDARFVLQPGVVMQLPQAPFTDGSRSRLTAVILSADAGPAGGREETVIFNDAYFRVAQPAQMAALRTELGSAAANHPQWGLTILADRHVNLDTLVRVLGLAREVGIREANIGTRAAAPEDARAGGRPE
jgi:biopolymer transport protein ExbD